jgi:ubiquinone/menaquinone biosynthesis C-methylase UbiE
MTSQPLSFDRVADIYDATRALPDHVLATIAQTIVTATNATEASRFLELGVGTGRIALPLLQYGFSYTGVDISPAMIDVLRTKAGDSEKLTLVEADVTQLPFADASFDVALTVHLLHLVPDWRRVLSEIRRVLTPDGYYIYGSDGSVDGQPAGAIRRQWRDVVRELGADARPEHGTREAVQTELIETGALLASYRVVQWEDEVTPGRLLEAIRLRTFSQSWQVPDDVMEEAHRRMIDWATEQYGDLTKPVSNIFEFGFDMAWWPPSSQGPNMERQENE